MQDETAIARLCSRWDSCSVNNCPLDPFYPNRVVCRDDKERVCPVEKGVRLRAAAQFPGVLRFAGLTSREFKAKARWDNLSDAVKVSRLKKLAFSAFRPKTTPRPAKTV